MKEKVGNDPIYISSNDRLLVLNSASHQWIRDSNPGTYKHGGWKGISHFSGLYQKRDIDYFYF